MDRKASHVWVLIAAVPFAGELAAIINALYLDERNKWFTLLFFVPILGPVISYVMTGAKDRYLSSMSEWFFLGQVLLIFILWVLVLASLL